MTNIVSGNRPNPLPISEGGTGANTLAGAQAALGIRNAETFISGLRLYRSGDMVSLNGYVALPITIPVGYRPKEDLFAPCNVGTESNALYAAIWRSGSITYGNAGETSGNIILSISYLTSDPFPG